MELIELKDISYGTNEFNYEILITDYEEGYHNGVGEAWGYYNDGRDKPFDKWYLSHCSCYGPFEHNKPVSYTEEDADKLIPDNIKEIFLQHNIIIG